MPHRRLPTRPIVALTALALAAAALAGCGGAGGSRPATALSGTTAAPPLTRGASMPSPAGKTAGGAGGVYAHDLPGMLSPTVRGDPSLVYVPNSMSDTVSVIDPHSYRVIRTIRVGALPQHVVPSWDLRTLWVTNDEGNSLTPLDPRTGRRKGKPVAVADPYNMYFTTDGRYAIVVAERLRRLDFRDAQTMKLVSSLHVPCSGVDHADFTADGSRLVASCEFSGRLEVVDVAGRRLVRTVELPSGAHPQDVKLSPDGRVFYVADMTRGGVYEVDARSFRVVGFIRTGADAHGIYVSRDAKDLYVTNRRAGSVSVISAARRRVIATWPIPNGTPDMGGVSADGRTLWLSGRYRAEVYAIDTRTGRLRARIPVGDGPHGLAVFPQPGRYSLGHTGVFR